jgi:acetolactate synthase-1/2/3 large subunit
MSATASGAKIICEALARAGVECVFGLPGTQNVAFFEALRTSSLRTVVATHELSAAMMANGYYRTSGRVAALATIPGPGFTFALTGIAEAALDSAALVHIVGLPARSPGTHFQLQAIDQATMGRPVYKAIHSIEHATDAASVIASACADAARGEPGPVLVQVSRSMLDEQASVPTTPLADRETSPDSATFDRIVAALESAKRCVIIAGQGCNAAGDALTRLAERLSAAVVTTTSGRGIVSEDHPLSLGFELGGNGAETLNALIDSSDLVLAIGCKFSHNGSRGFRLRVASEKLVHVDAAQHVLGANYPAKLALCADASAFIEALLSRLESSGGRWSGFGADELARLRERAYAEGLSDVVEPRIHGTSSGKAKDFFAALRRALPSKSCLVTDSGLHQVLTRHHFRVLGARGLLTPTNLQSMGFAIGAATGACVANPGMPIVAIIGDGGLALSGLELMTAVRERLRLTVIVFVDGAYGLIRMQQLSTTGRAFATEFTPPDFAAFAEAVGARHLRVESDAESVLRSAIGSDGVTIVEVAVGDTLPMHWMRAKAIAKHAAKRGLKSKLRKLLRR